MVRGIRSQRGARRGRRLLAGAGLVALVGWLGPLRCDAPVRVATFNIRAFPGEDTEPEAVARAIAGLDADILGVQEIRSADALESVLLAASASRGRDYRSALSRCHGSGRLTTGLVWDASAWTLVARRDYPQLRPDEDDACVPSQPGIAGVFEDEDGRRVVVLSVHMKAFPHGYPERREQWRRVLHLQSRLAAEFDAEVLALGDFNSTGFTTEPPEEPRYVRELVASVGYELLSDQLACTEYYRPRGSTDFVPSILDHVVATGGDWRAASVMGLCARLRCAVTESGRMDREFFTVSDHCPVLVEGRP